MATTYTPLAFGNRVIIIACDQSTGAATIANTLTQDDIDKPTTEADATPQPAPDTETDIA